MGKQPHPALRAAFPKGKDIKTKPPELLIQRFVAGVVSLELTARGFGDRCSTN